MATNFISFIKNNKNDIDLMVPAHETNAPLLENDSQIGDNDNDDEDFNILGDIFTNTCYENVTISIPCYCHPGERPITLPQVIRVDIQCSKAACTDYDLTGQIIWPVSVLLAHYLASHCGRRLINGQKVVELGAGCGLPGIVAAEFANRTVLTDGNEAVVRLLRDNVESALSQRADRVLSEENKKIRPNPPDAIHLSAFKLVWGNREELNHIIELLGGPADVVVAADVVQWPAVVEPLLHCVKALLWSNTRKRSACSDEIASNKPPSTFVLGIVERAQSTQELFFQCAKTLGFCYRRVGYSEFLEGGVVPDTCKEFGGRRTEIYELRLEDWTVPPVLLNAPTSDSEDMTFGEHFENTVSLPC